MLLAALALAATVAGTPVEIPTPDGEVALGRESAYYKSISRGGSANRVLAAFAGPEDAPLIEGGAPFPKREWSVVSGLQRTEDITHEMFRTRIAGAIENATIEGMERQAAGGGKSKVSIDRPLGVFSRGERYLCHGFVIKANDVPFAKVLGTVNVRNRLVTLALSQRLEGENDIASAKAKCTAWAEATVRANP